MTHGKEVPMSSSEDTGGMKRLYKGEDERWITGAARRVQISRGGGKWPATAPQSQIDDNFWGTPGEETDWGSNWVNDMIEQFVPTLREYAPEQWGSTAIPMDDRWLAELGLQVDFLPNRILVGVPGEPLKEMFRRLPADEINS
jgi:hypothetical protein